MTVGAIKHVVTPHPWIPAATNLAAQQTKIGRIRLDFAGNLTFNVLDVLGVPTTFAAEDASIRGRFRHMTSFFDGCLRLYLGHRPWSSGWRHDSGTLLAAAIY